MIAIFNFIVEYLEDFRGSEVLTCDSFINQDLYKSMLEKELKRFPSVGLYENESKEDWDKFVKYLETVYNDVDGERREIIDRVKVELNIRKDYFDDLLSDIGLHSDSSIRRICNRLKMYIPCPDYKKLLDAQSNYNKAIILMNQYQQSESDIKSKILLGMRKKYPEDECQEKLKEVIEKNKLIVENGKVIIDELTKLVEANDKYQRYELIKQEFQAYIDEWTNVDSGVGRENISKGKSFEEKCEKDGIDLILGRLNLRRSNVKILTNQKWAQCPGEIDIAILDKTESKVICLAECKSRLFDIVQGYKQSGPNRAPEKQSIQLFKKTVPVPRDTPCFVLTALPQNDYFLGIESKVKLDLNKYTLENDFCDIDFDEVYKTLKAKYEKLESPLQWYYKYSKTNLFVVK